MNSRLINVLSVVLLFALVIGSALWLGIRLRERAAAPPTATLLPTPTRTKIATPETPTPTPPLGYRLAGVASRASYSYAVIEGPDDKHTMYREGDEIPGLGRLGRVTDEHVVIATASGEIRLFVIPAATGTPTATRPSATPTLKPTAEPTRPVSGRVRESNP